MARPWFEFLLPRHLPWQAGLYRNARPDVRPQGIAPDPFGGAAAHYGPERS